ncbi:MAG TPA: zf-HC2 domain-containing protein [Polyangiaceae bacterium]
MDCEKFENNLIDELYGELDELTSAAMKRHAAGCSRCAAMLGGLRATRKVAVLSVEEPSPELEDRILAAARDAQKVVPFAARLSRAVSRAGAWAMRPQTAMAAVFLLAIGSSFVLMQSRHSSPRSASLSVHDEGAPEPMAAASAVPFDPRAAAAAHGTEEQKQRGARTTTPLDLPLASALAMDDSEQGPGKAAAKDLSRGDLDGLLDKGNYASNAGPMGGAPMAATPPAATATAAFGSGGGTGAVQDQRAYPSGGTSFDTAMASYRAGRYDEAMRLFDAMGSADPNAALWAARSAREGSGCVAAVSRFDQVAQRAGSSSVGNDATFDGGHCYRILGNTEAARGRFSKLLGVSGYGARAQEELDAMAPANAAARQKSAPSPKPAATMPAATDRTNAY